MSITFVQMSAADRDDLIEFLTTNRCLFHVHQAPGEADVRARVDSSHFWNEDRQGYWAVRGGQRRGMVVLEDLQDG